MKNYDNYYEHELRDMWINTNDRIISLDVYREALGDNRNYDIYREITHLVNELNAIEKAILKVRG